MLRKGLAVAVILLFIGMCIVPSTAVTELKDVSTVSFDGNILYVGGSGPNNYSTIQSAIDDAEDGDTVFVFDDSSPYIENILINKTINLIGEDKNTTVIDADFDGIPVNINACGCMVSGFTIQNCAWDNSLDFVYSNMLINKCEKVVILDNRLIIGDFGNNAIIEGIFLNDSYYCTIQDNIIFDNKIRGPTSGIALGGGSSYNVITRNNIAGYCKGVYIAFHSSCNENIISENYLHNNLFGIDIDGNNYNQILNNIIENNKYRGIRLTNSHHNSIIGNNIGYNGRGVDIDSGIILMDEGCHDNIVSGNLILNNSKYGIVLKDTSGNIVNNNNFINNDKIAYFEYSYILTNKNSWHGNYWNRTRILPYIIIGKGYLLGFIPITWFNIDWHPALRPYDIGEIDSLSIGDNVISHEGIGGYVK